MKSVQQIIEEQKGRGGIDLKLLNKGTKIEAQTKNTLYSIEVLENGKYLVQGGRHYPDAMPIRINGSAWGGSIIKVNWLGIEMHIEMQHPDPEKGMITTSAVRSLKIIAPDNSWEYTL